MLRKSELIKKNVLKLKYVISNAAPFFSFSFFDFLLNLKHSALSHTFLSLTRHLAFGA